MGEEFTIFGIRVERFDEPDSPINLWVMDANQKWHLVKSEPNASQFVIEAYATSVNAALRAVAVTDDLPPSGCAISESTP